MNPQSRPILFNTEMVKAILSGKKTVTRRIIKPSTERYSISDDYVQLLAALLWADWIRCAFTAAVPDW